LQKTAKSFEKGLDKYALKAYNINIERR